MDRTPRTRVRTPSTRPSGAGVPDRPVGNRLCARCPAYPMASFRHGALIKVEIRHMCGQLPQPQPVQDWLGAVDLNELRARHENGQTGY